MRQKDKTHIAAIENMLVGDISTAFEKIASRILPVDDRQTRLDSMAQHYVSTPTRDSTLLLLPTRHECDAVNTHISRLLKDNGELRGNGVSVTCLLPKSLTTAASTSAYHYLPGEMVRFNQGCSGLIK